MKSTKSGLNNNAGPNALLAPFGPVGFEKRWPTKLFGRICVTQKNWQDFGEWRLERRKKLERQNSSDLISSSLKSTTMQHENNCEANMDKFW